MLRCSGPEVRTGGPFLDAATGPPSGPGRKTRAPPSGQHRVEACRADRGAFEGHVVGNGHHVMRGQ